MKRPGTDTWLNPLRRLRKLMKDIQNARTCMTEDLQEAQKFGGVQVINPFQHTPQLSTGFEH